MMRPAPDLLVVEDEDLIRVLLEDMLDELGFSVTATAGSISEAKREVEARRFSAAILDVNVAGQEIFPVADMLVDRGLPFMLVTGYVRLAYPNASAAAPRCRSLSKSKG